MGKQRKYTPDEDAPLLSSLQQGEPVSLETLVWKYLKRAFNLAYLLTGDYETAAEAAKNAMVTALRDINSLRSTSRFSTWLAGLVLGETRRLNEFRENSKAAAVEADIEEVATSPAGMEHESQLGRSLRDDIRGLPPELAEVLVLHYVRGFKLERMTEVLQLREEILLSRLFEAQEKLALTLKLRAEGIMSSRRLKERGEALPHADIRRSFSAYLDNSSDETTKNDIRKHLGSCGSCRESLAELEWIVEHLKKLQDIDPPPGLAAAIMAEVNATAATEPAGKEVSAPLPRITILLAAAVLVTVGIYWLLSGNSEVMPPSDATPAATAGKPFTGQTTAAGSEGGQSARLPSASALARGDEVTTGKMPGVLPAAPVPVPLPAGQEVRPSSQPIHAATAAAAVRKGSDTAPSLPAEWGESIAPFRPAPAKTAVPKKNGDEVAILLRTADPEGAVQEIERAVTALGGKITGRAYGSGNDMLYSRIDASRFMELVARLRQLGTILEMPHLPDAAEGNMDLVIRW